MLMSMTDAILVPTAGGVTWPFAGGVERDIGFSWLYHKITIRWAIARKASAARRLMNQGRFENGCGGRFGFAVCADDFSRRRMGVLSDTPFLYFTDYQEPALANAVREGRCREFAVFGWKPEETSDPQARDTFERSKLNWPELTRASRRSASIGIGS